MTPLRLIWGLIPFLFASGCTKSEATRPDSVWSDEVQAIELLLTGPNDFCGEIKTFSHTMTGSRLTPRRVTLFKGLGGAKPFDPSLCRQDYVDFERASFIVNPASEKAIQYATTRDTCLYSKDASFNILILPDEQLASVIEEIKPQRYGALSFSRNETDVFWNREHDWQNGPYGISLEGGNPKTFQPINDSYGKDDKSVWMESVKLVDADPATFYVGNSSWSYDAQHVYYRGLGLPGADANSFQSISDPYGKDKNAIYYKDQKMERVDPASFQAFAFGVYSRDANAVIFDGMIMEGADVKTFVGNADGIGTDATAVYVWGKKLGLSRATYTQVGPYLKDASKVYYYDQLMEGADAATFEYKRCIGFRALMVLGCTPSSGFDCYAQDKNFKYRNGKKLTPDQVYFPE